MASRSASERLLQHLEASQGLGMALETYRAQLRPAIWPQKTPAGESPGDPWDVPRTRFLKPVGIISMKKRRQT